MNLKRLLLLLASSMLGACSAQSSSDDVAGGGFETSDLTAVAVDTVGAQVQGARIWLVQNDLDSVRPPASLDSLLVGPAGAGVFTDVRRHGPRLGIEAWSGDTLFGFAAVADPASADTVRVTLRRTRVLQLPCSGQVGNSFMAPGMHFLQQPPQTCVDSFRVLVPAGARRLVAIPGDSLLPPYHLPITDSLPPWSSYLPGGPNNPWRPIPGPYGPVPPILPDTGAMNRYQGG